MSVIIKDKLNTNREKHNNSIAQTNHKLNKMLRSTERSETRNQETIPPEKHQNHKVEENQNTDNMDVTMKDNYKLN